GNVADNKVRIIAPGHDRAVILNQGMRQSIVWLQFEVYHLAGCDHEGVVGAGDGDSDILGGEAAVVVGDLDRVGLGQRLARRQEVNGVVGNREGPADGAGAAAGGVVRERGR